uniref:NADH-ubiquinone oxidoreductase chain 3 n=1 Tax=Pseudopotamorites peniculus TaxID=2904919 RepID=A0A9E8LQK5_9NEOP|nr:NADH dehydrogenase subunit 3 [Pseudopotamorites peniculus]UZZ44305.1 NADH dehydrogenase subunit 3 [Pseudopotamorites peniculus]
MPLMTLTLILTILISNLMIFIALTLNKKSSNDIEKISPFECGFDPHSNPRIPFSIHFFLITIIFLIFDVEIAILIPIIMIFSISNLNQWFIISTFFILILIAGLYYEWNQNMLNWTN